MKVVLDTNVLISSTIWNKSESQKLLSQLIKEGVRIFISNEILKEYETTLRRDFDLSNRLITILIKKINSFSNVISEIDSLHDNSMFPLSFKGSLQLVVVKMFVRKSKRFERIVIRIF